MIVYWSQMKLKLCTLVHLALASKNFNTNCTNLHEFSAPKISRNRLSVCQKTYGVPVHSGLVINTVTQSHGVNNAKNIKCFGF